jgi:type II secretory pathway pseudopilin PulG
MKKISQKTLNSRAFSMLELVFVVVVIGILAATIIPQTKTNPLQEAAIQVASHIKYTQHLAMMDDRYDSGRKDDNGDVIWYKDRWQLVFGASANADNQEAYTIFSDTLGTGVNRGDADEAEIARNPQNLNQRMTGGYTGAVALDIRHSSFVGMKKLNIGKSYGVTSATLGGGCRANWKRISFDHLGRPFQGKQSSMNSPYNIGSTQRLIKTICTVTLSDGSDSVSINIEPETGYVSTTF